MYGNGMQLNEPLSLLSYQKNGCEHVFQCVSFYNYLSIRNLVSEDWSESECFLEGIKSFVVTGVKQKKIMLG